MFSYNTPLLYLCQALCWCYTIDSSINFGDKGYNMPEKQVETWTILKSCAPAVIGIMLAFMVATARERRAGKSMRESIIEGFICACLSFGVISILEQVGLNTSYSQFFGVLIGFIGTTRLSDLAYNFLDLFMRRK